RSSCGPARGRSGVRPGRAASPTCRAPCPSPARRRRGWSWTSATQPRWPRPSTACRAARRPRRRGRSGATAGALARRAGGGAAPAAELVLARSRYDGPPVRLASGREYLARAARLGFRIVELPDDGGPIACRDGSRTYVWQPLGESAVVAAGADVARVDVD